MKDNTQEAYFNVMNSLPNRHFFDEQKGKVNNITEQLGKLMVDINNYAGNLTNFEQSLNNIQSA